MRAVETQKHTLVVYYGLDKEVQKISRFNDPIKAKKALFESLLIGMHAEIIATDVSYEEAQSLIYFHRKEIGPTKPKAEPKPKIPRTPGPKFAKVKPAFKIKTREETNEFGTFIVNTTKIRFVPV